MEKNPLEVLPKIERFAMDLLRYPFRKYKRIYGFSSEITSNLIGKYPKFMGKPLILF